MKQQKKLQQQIVDGGHWRLQCGHACYILSWHAITDINKHHERYKSTVYTIGEFIQTCQAPNPLL
jgi:hypothetical protein